MPGFPFGGSRGRRLAVVEDVGAKEDNTAVSEGEGLQADGEKDEVVLLDKGDATLQDLTGGPTEYIDKELGGGGQGSEARTTHTTKAMKARATRVRFDSLQWMALTAAILSLLGAAYWQMSDKLPVFAKAKPEPMEILPYDFTDPAWQVADLKIELQRLHNKWDKASDTVKTAFAEKYTLNKSKDDALEPFLRPAQALLDAGLPEDAEKETFSNQIALIKGAVQAAQSRINALTIAEGIRAPTEGREPMPSLEELQQEKKDLIDYQGFALMLTRHGTPEPAEAGIPKVLAQGLAEAVAASDLGSETEADVAASFDDFLDNVGFGEHEDLSLPGEKRPFPTALLSSLLDLQAEVRQGHPFPVEVLSKFSSNWNVETASEMLKALETREAKLTSVLKALKEQALDNYYASYRVDPTEENLFTTVVGLL